MPVVEPRPRGKPVRMEPPLPTEEEMLQMFRLFDARIEGSRQMQQSLERALGPEVVRAADDMLAVYLFPQSATRKSARAAARGMAKVAAQVQTRYERAHRHLPREWLRVADRMLAIRRAAAAEKDDLAASPQARARFRTQGWADTLTVPGDLVRRTGSLLANSSGFQMATKMSERLNGLSHRYLSQSNERYLKEDARLKEIEAKIPRRSATAAELGERLEILGNTHGDFLDADVPSSRRDSDAIVEIMLGEQPSVRVLEDADLQRKELGRVSARDRLVRMGTALLQGDNPAFREHFDRMVLARKSKREVFLDRFKKRKEAFASGQKNLSLLNYAEFGVGGGWQNAIFQLTDFMNAKAPEFSPERRDRPRWKSLLGYVGIAARACSLMGRVYSTLAIIEHDLIEERQQRFLDDNRDALGDIEQQNTLAAAVRKGIQGMYEISSVSDVVGLKRHELIRATAVYVDAIEASCTRGAGGLPMMPFGDSAGVATNDGWPKHVETWAETARRTGIAEPQLSQETMVAIQEGDTLQNKALISRGAAESPFVKMLSTTEMAYVRPTFGQGLTPAEERMALAADERNWFRKVGALGEGFSEKVTEMIGDASGKARAAAQGEHLEGAITPLEASGMLAEAALEEISPTYRMLRPAYDLYRYLVPGGPSLADLEAKMAADLLAENANGVGGGWDWLNWAPMFARAARKGKTWWDWIKPFPLLFGFYKSLMLEWKLAVGMTIVQALGAFIIMDVRTMFLMTTAISLGVALPIKVYEYLTQVADPTAETNLDRWFAAAGDRVAAVYRRIFGEIPKVFYTMRGAMRALWTGTLVAGGGILFTAVAINDLRAALSLLSNLTSAGAFIFANWPVFLGVSAVSVGGLMLLASRANRWYDQTMNATFSVGAALIERPELTLLGVRTMFQLVTLGPDVLAAAADPLGALGRAGEVAGSAWGTVSTLAVLVHPKVLWGRFVGTASDESDDTFLAMWNLAGGAVWPLITVSTDVPDGASGEERMKIEASALNTFRVLTCAVMEETLRRRNFISGDSDFLGTCVQRAFSENLGPPSI